MFDLTTLLSQYPPAGQTIRVQARLDEVRTQGPQAWEALFPREDVNSIRISELQLPTKRFVADRREWNATGRLIPLVDVSEKAIEMIPIESYFTVDEYEMQILAGQMNNRADLVLDMIGAKLPARIDGLADANVRRIEVDSYHGWLYGTIEVRNPATGELYTMSLGIDSNRYVTEDWSGANNAWEKFMDAIQDAYQQYGAYPLGAIAPLSTIKKIKADAPQPFGVELTNAELMARISGEIGRQFFLRSEERTVDIPTDGGPGSFTKTALWKPQTLAFIPPNAEIGVTAYAPVIRAMQYAAQLPDDSIDVRGQTVFMETENGNRNLKVEVQVNALPIPITENVLVYTVGV